jgi:hypothetical protein
MRIKTLIVSAAWFALVGSPHAGAQQAASFSGTVVDDSDAPIGGATVHYNNVPPGVQTPDGGFTTTGPLISTVIETQADGSFQVQNVPPGTYLLCARGTLPQHLASCDWQGTTRINLSAGQALQGITLVVARGTLLTFAVQDARSQIQDYADLIGPGGQLPLSGGNFRIGVFVGTRYLPAERISLSAGTHQYQVAVSKAASARLLLNTPLRVTDSAGNALTNSSSPTIPANGQNEVITNLIVP